MPDRSNAWVRTCFVVCVGSVTSCGTPERVSERPAEAHWPEATWARAGVIVSGARVSPLARIPARSIDAVRVEAAPNRWLEQRALDVRDVMATEDAGRARFADAAADILRFATREGYEEVRVLRDASLHRARYRVRLGEGLARLRLRERLVEALDASGVAWLRSPAPFAVDARGVRREADVNLTRERDEGDEWLVTVTLDGAGLTAPIALDPGWFVTTSMSTPRANFAMVQLGSGKFLVTGGDTDRTYATELSTTELFDPTTKTWTSGPSMAGKRARHGAVVLADGKVLVAGGGECFYCSGSGTTLISTAEIYDGSSWTAAASMTSPRSAAGYMRTATNTVLAAGGGTGGTNVSKAAEVYDPVANKWTATANNMTDFRAWPMVAARNGKVLVFGGWTYYNALSSVDSFDPTTNTFSAVSPMTTGRVFASVGVLDDGSVLAVGGSKDVNSNSTSAAALATAEVLSPSTGVWTAIAGPKVAHSGAASLVLAGGKMLVAGGWGVTQTPVLEVDLYDRVAATWTSQGSMTFGHAFGAMAPAGTSDYAVFGGIVGNYDYTTTFTAIATTEISGTALSSSAKCTDNGNCTSGFCVDGRCCNAACTGACEACDVPGSEGNCIPVNGAPHGGRTPCGGSPECAKTCDGISTTCTQGKTTTTCGGPSCTGNMLSTGGTCSGDSTNACNKTAGSPCPGSLLCDTPTACKTSCLSNADCVSGTVCDVASGTCGAPKPDAGPMDAAMEAAMEAATDAPPEDVAVADTLEPFDGAKTSIPDKPLVTGSFERCVHDADCPTHHCVEGICCDTACTDRCHSCALLSSPGVCTLEPAGVDLKGECGAENTCTGTCGGAGECIGAGAGSMCARNRCTGPSVGTGPAYCSGPGAACSNADVVPFDCSPYACAPAFGACLTACVSSDDCANGFVCDIGSKTCVAPAPPADSGGCSMTRAASTFGWMSVSMAIALSVVRRRRKSQTR